MPARSKACSASPASCSADLPSRGSAAMTIAGSYGRPTIMSGLAGPVFALCMLTPSFGTMIAMLGLTSLLVGFHLGPIFAIVQTVAKPNMRALAAATVLLTATCFGQGIGPLVVGGLNDAWKS